MYQGDINTMQQPILKSNWERYSAHVDLELEIVQSLVKPYSSGIVKNFKLLSEGCANTNYKIEFSGTHPPLVLRIYVREKSALAREIYIHDLVENLIPVPDIFYHDTSCKVIEHPYALMQWVDGILMRDLILNNEKDGIASTAFEAGIYLYHISQIKYDQGGFFQADGSIRAFNEDEKYLAYVNMLLNNDTVIQSLEKARIKKLNELITNNQSDLPLINDANLTHGDYDPANILVVKKSDIWQIAAVLDWEFAFSGTYFLDIGMMLRFSHKITPTFEQRFIKGFKDEGGKLPETWKKSAKMMDLLCLLQLILYNPKSQRPKMHADLIGLIDFTIYQWQNF